MLAAFLGGLVPPANSGIERHDGIKREGNKSPKKRAPLPPFKPPPPPPGIQHDEEAKLAYRAEL